MTTRAMKSRNYFQLVTVKTETLLPSLSMYEPFQSAGKHVAEAGQ